MIMMWAHSFCSDDMGLGSMASASDSFGTASFRLSSIWAAGSPSGRGRRRLPPLLLRRCHQHHGITARIVKQRPKGV
jgi:hypothetical protein